MVGSTAEVSLHRGERGLEAVRGAGVWVRELGEGGRELSRGGRQARRVGGDFLDHGRQPGLSKLLAETFDDCCSDGFWTDPGLDFVRKLSKASIEQLMVGCRCIESVADGENGSTEERLEL